jgi:hypothetical protein
VTPHEHNIESVAGLPGQRGLFVISLDFELYWGMRHEAGVKDYIPRLVGARIAIPQLLKLFTEFSIRATWATVGFLFFDRTRTLLEYAPEQRPQYRNSRLYPYSDLPPDDAKETADSIYFAPSLIRLIAETEHQELGTHTFSHYFCLEEGQDIETFRQDMLAARAAAQKLGFERNISSLASRRESRPTAAIRRHGSTATPRMRINHQCDGSVGCWIHTHR